MKSIKIPTCSRTEILVSTLPIFVCIVCGQEDLLKKKWGSGVRRSCLAMSDGLLTDYVTSSQVIHTAQPLFCDIHNDK